MCQFQQEKFCFLGYVISSHVVLTFRYLLDGPKLICLPTPPILMLKMSSSTGSSTSAAQIVLEYDGFDDGVLILTRSSLLRVLIWFANFYQYFISKKKIAVLLTLMLKTSRNIKFTTRPEKSGVRVGDSSNNDGHKNKYTSRLKTSVSTDLSTSVAQVRFKYDEVGRGRGASGKSVKKSTKSC